MTTLERTICKIELLKGLAETIKGYGNLEQPLTVGIFKAIVEEEILKQEKTQNFILKL